MIAYLVGAVLFVGMLTGAAYWLDDNGYSRAMAEVETARNTEKLREKDLLVKLTAAKAALEAARGESRTTIATINDACMEVLLHTLDPSLPGLLDDTGSR